MNGQASERVANPLTGCDGSVGFLMQIVRYGGVAVVAAGVDTGVLWLLSGPLKVHYSIAAAAGFLCGLVVNFLLARRFVFGATKLRSTAEFASYAVIGLVGVGLTEFILYVGIEGFGAAVLMAKAVALLIVFFWNFLARRYLIYRLFSAA